MEGEERALSITAAARELGIHRDTLRRWIDKGLVQTVPRPSASPSRWTRRVHPDEIRRAKIELVKRGE